MLWNKKGRSHENKDGFGDSRHFKLVIIQFSIYIHPERDIEDVEDVEDAEDVEDGEEQVEIEDRDDEDLRSFWDRFVFFWLYCLD